MARLDYYSCDPFRAWNRLEGRPRKAEFEDVFAATVHDPLWFLTRQWQFGEMQGRYRKCHFLESIDVRFTDHQDEKRRGSGQEVFK